MKDKNTLVRYHNIQYNTLKDTESYLEKMAQKGWMLKEIKGNGKFIFNKCDPEKVIFSVNIFTKGSEYDTHLNSANLEYNEYCESVGWNFICMVGPLHVFMTKDENTPAIESDPMMTLKEINKRESKKKILSYFMLFVAAYTVLTSSFVSMHRSP